MTSETAVTARSYAIPMPAGYRESIVAEASRKWTPGQEQTPSWIKFLKRWANARDVEDILGLLHVCFDIKLEDEEERIERVSFFMGLSDGWRTQKPEEALDEYRVRESAFKILCSRIFEREGLAGIGAFTSERFVSVATWFFRVSIDRDEVGIANLKEVYVRERPRLEFAAKFALELAKFIQTFNSFGIFNREEGEKVRTMLDTYRPSATDITLALSKEVAPLEGTMIQRAEELVLRAEYRFPKEGGLRKPLCIEELPLAITNSRLAKCVILSRARERAVADLRAIQVVSS